MVSPMRFPSRIKGHENLFVALVNRKLKIRWFHLMQLLRLHEVYCRYGIYNLHISTAFPQNV